MSMIKIILLGERGKKALSALTSTNRAYCINNDVYLVPEAALSLLSKLDAPYRKIEDVFSGAKTLTKEFVEDLENYAGKLVVEKVGRSHGASLEHLFHPKPKYRFAALQLLYLKWGLTQDVVDECEIMARSDTDANVRGLASQNLGSYYLGSGNRRISELLARIVCNKEEVADVRRSAYWSLFSLQENYDWERPSFPRFKFPDDVDWAFVDYCLRYNVFKRTYRRLARFLLRMRFVRKK